LLETPKALNTHSPPGAPSTPPPQFLERGVGGRAMCVVITLMDDTMDYQQESSITFFRAEQPPCLGRSRRDNK